MALNPLLSADSHLQAGSPCIGAGTNLAWMTNAFDIDHQTRIFGARTDIGMDEAVVAATQIGYTNVPYFHWDTVQGSVCQLQMCTNLVMTNWINVQSGVTALTRQVVLVHSNAVANQAVYRLFTQ